MNRFHRFNVFRKYIAVVGVCCLIGKVTRLLPFNMRWSCAIRRDLLETKMSSAGKIVKGRPLRGNPESAQRAVRLSLWERTNVIHQVPAICFGKSFAKCRHRFFAGCDLPEERSVRFRCELWIGEFRRVNI